MKSYFLLLVTRLALVQAQDAGCSVCGTDMKVTKPDDIFAFPGQPVVTCKNLEDGGKSGLVPLAQCSFLPPLIKDTCGCQEVSDEGCAVCGVGKKISLPNEVFAFPGQPVVKCGPLQDAGLTGVIPLDQCQFLPSLIDTVCGCIDNSAPLPMPTRSPVQLPGQQPDIPPSQIGSYQEQTASAGGSSMPMGAIIGIIAGVVVVGGLLIALVFISTSKMRKDKPIITAEATAVNSPPNDAFPTGEEPTAVDDKEMI